MYPKIFPSPAQKIEKTLPEKRKRFSPQAKATPVPKNSVYKEIKRREMMQ